jgi:hypothetical protein
MIISWLLDEARRPSMSDLHIMANSGAGDAVRYKDLHLQPPLERDDILACTARPY